MFGSWGCQVINRNVYVKWECPFPPWEVISTACDVSVLRDAMRLMCNFWFCSRSVSSCWLKTSCWQGSLCVWLWQQWVPCWYAILPWQSAICGDHWQQLSLLARKRKVSKNDIRHHMRSLSTLLALCEGNSWVIGGFLSQRIRALMFSSLSAWASCWTNSWWFKMPWCSYERCQIFICTCIREWPAFTFNSPQLFITKCVPQLSSSVYLQMCSLVPPRK